MKKIIKLLVATGLVLATTNMVFAQSYTATAGTIKDDVDYALDERYYMDANINKFYINGNLGNKINSKVTPNNLTSLNLQTAFQFSKLYLGFSLYGGAAWKISSKTKALNTEIQPDNSYRAYSNLINSKILFGFNNMAISAFYNFNSHNRYKGTDYNTRPEVTYTEVPSMSNLQIGARWGGNFSFDKFILKPLASFDVTIKEDEIKGSYGDSINTYNYNIGLGSDFVFGNKSDLYNVFDVNYYLTIGSSLNESTKVTNKDTTNMVLLSYLMNYNVKDRAILGCKIDVKNWFISNKTVNSDGSVGQPTTFTYSLVPTLSLGAKFVAVPSVFNINVGMMMNLPNVRVTTKKNSNTNTTTTTTNVNGRWNPQFEADVFIPRITTGFEWTPYKNLVIDTAFLFNVGNTFEQIFNSINIGISYRK